MLSSVSVAGTLQWRNRRPRPGGIKGALRAPASPHPLNVYSRSSGQLMSVPFDSVALEVTGPPVPVGVDVGVSRSVGGGNFALSRDGVLAYVHSGTRKNGPAWLDRQCRTERLALPPQEFSDPSLSRDGTQFAITIRNGQTRDIWIYDLRRGGLSRRTLAGMHVFRYGHPMVHASPIVKGWPVSTGCELMGAVNRSDSSSEPVSASFGGLGLAKGLYGGDVAGS